MQKPSIEGFLRLKFFSLLSLVILTVSSLPSAYGQKFRPDDPIWRDEDNENVPASKSFGVADYYDFLENTFFHAGDSSKQRALNINTLGEVPDSNWFTNRHGRRTMTLDELLQGPDRGGPAEGKWLVTRNKQGGVTPGIRVVDSTGTMYQLKFDPLSNPEMATSAEVICTKFFYAIGYFVAEDYLVSFSRSQIALSPKAEFVDLVGKKRPMTQKDVDEILTHAYQDKNGRYRAVASKFIEGKPVGEYKYYGTRSDDPNDIFPHEHRRELRGLRVFSAWLNHDDSRSVNTFDTLISEDGRQFIRHYLFDFGSTLGSGSIFAQKPRAGNEYLWEPGPTFKSIFSLGLWVRPWIRVDYPNHPSIGNFEAEFFDPVKWKPEYPNRAFENLTDEDAFWAARIVVAFTDQQIRAIVKTGKLTDSKAEDYLAQCLIKRRNKVGQTWLNHLNPLDEFSVSGSRLVFDNAATRLLKISEADHYEASWSRFNNHKQQRESVGSKQTVKQKEFTIPSEVFAAPSNREPLYAVAEITTHSPQQPKWGRPVQVYLRKDGEKISVVGIERE